MRQLEVRELARVQERIEGPHQPSAHRTAVIRTERECIELELVPVVQLEELRREMRRRAAIEPVIGHLKDDHRMGRNYLAHSSGDAINAVLAAVGYNFRRLIQWLRLLMLRILIVANFAAQLKPA